MFRFWIGGTGNWNDTAHWSTSSGGGGGASVPTSSDTVTVNGASTTGGGSVNITLDVAAFCSQFTWNTDGAGLAASSFAQGNFDLTVSASFLVLVNAVASPFWTSTGGIVLMNASSLGNTFRVFSTTTSSIGQFTVVFFGTGNWAIAGSQSVMDTFDLQKGAVTFLAGAEFVNFVTEGTTTTRTLHLGSAVITATNFFFDDEPGGLTLDPGVSQLFVREIFSGTGHTFNDLQLVSTATALELDGSNTFNNLTFNIVGGAAADATVTFETGTTQTVTGLFQAEGDASSQLILVSSSPGNEVFINAAGTNGIQYVTPTDNHALGAIPFDDSVGGVDGGGNTNWLFTNTSAFTPQVIIF